MGQNYDGLLVKDLNVRRSNEILFALFKHVRTLIQRKGFFFKLATVQSDKAFL